MDLQLRASEWAIGEDGVPFLVKPCGCKVVWRGGEFDFTWHVGNKPVHQLDDSELERLRDRMLKEVREADGEVEIDFGWRYRRRWKSKEQEISYRAVMELADRKERENDIGPYNPLTIELMENLAREHAPKPTRTPAACDCDHEFDPSAGKCVECGAHWDKYQRDIQKQIAASYAVPTPLPISIKHDPLERSYYIRLDTDGRHRTMEEMKRDVEKGLIDALNKHQQELGAKLMPKT